MNSLSRRHFLKGTAATLAVLAGSGLFWDPVRKIWASDSLPAGVEMLAICSKGPGKKSTGYDGGVVTQPGFVHAYEVATGKTLKIDVPFWGHTLTQNPRNSKQVFTFEKWGRRGALVDLEAEAVVVNAEASEGKIFFGHAASIHDGIVTSEDDFGYDGGQLIVRDPSRLNIIRKMSTHGVNCHEFIAIDNGKTLVVANGGYPLPDKSQEGLVRDYSPNVAWVETSSGKLLHKVTFDDFEASHLTMSHDGWIFVGGAIYPWQKGFPKTTFAWSKDLKKRYVRAALISPEGRTFPVPVHPNGKEVAGEALSAAFIGKTGLVAYTSFEANAVCILHYKTQQVVGWLNIPVAKGVVADLTAPDSVPTILVSSGKERHNLIKIALPGHDEPIIAKATPGFGGDGAHLVRMYI